MASVGIAVGITHACVAKWINGTVNIIHNDNGDRTTPVCIAFTQTGKLVGIEAVGYYGDPSNVIYGFIPLLGKMFDDSVVQEEIKHLPYTVVKMANGKVGVEVNYNGDPMVFSIPELVAIILSKIKDFAEEYLGMQVENVVLSCPNFYGDAEREDLKLAGKIAGLNVMRIINEHTAVAKVHGYDNIQKETKVVVLHCGGGRFDASLLLIEEGIVETISYVSNRKICGDKLDEIIFKYLESEFKRKNQDADFTGSYKSCKKLMRAVKDAKHSLSYNTFAHIEVDSLFGGIDFNATISRNFFEGLTRNMFQQCIHIIEDILEQGRTKKEEIDHVYLSGGCMNIPILQELIESYFPKDIVDIPKNSEFVTVSGNAIQADQLKGETRKRISPIDIIPLSLKVEITGGIGFGVLSRNSTIPCTVIQEFTTFIDNQTHVMVNIYEGESNFVKHNVFLGSTVLYIPPMLKGEPRITMTLDIDSNGYITILLKEKSTGQMNTLKINSHKDRHESAESVQAIMDGFKKHQAENDRFIKQKESSSLLEYIRVFLPTNEKSNQLIPIGHPKITIPNNEYDNEYPMLRG